MYRNLKVKQIIIETEDGDMYIIPKPKKAEIREEKAFCEVYTGESLFPKATIPAGYTNVLTVKADTINEWTFVKEHKAGINFRSVNP